MIYILELHFGEGNKIIEIMGNGIGFYSFVICIDKISTRDVV